MTTQGVQARLLLGQPDPQGPASGGQQVCPEPPKVVYFLGDSTQREEATFIQRSSALGQAGPLTMVVPSELLRQSSSHSLG